MRVCIVTPFFSTDSAQSRPYFVQSILEQNEDITTILVTGDFCHTRKEKVAFDGAIQAKTLPYRSNISFSRFISHLFLSVSLLWSALRLRNEVEIYYVTAPFVVWVPVLRFLSGKKVIVDIVDFWPDSLPFKNHTVAKPFIAAWRFVNRFSVRSADRVVSLSSEFLKCCDAKGAQQILLGAKHSFINEFKLEHRRLSIAYIGNIGTLYDFETLIESLVLLSSSYDITFHIIGDGDRRDWLLKQLHEKSIAFTYYGIIYSDVELKSILSSVNLGFNGYLNTNATFSYKSITYFKFGLPIVNSMDGDMREFVERYNLGVNYLSGNSFSLFNALEKFLSNDISKYHSNVREFFMSHLSEEIIANKFMKIFKELGDDKAIS